MRKLELEEKEFLKLNNGGRIIVCQLILSGLLRVKRGGKTNADRTNKTEEF